MHRDLKPANILVDEAGNGYLSDFGIAKQFGSEIDPSLTGGLIGSPAHMSPEQLLHQPVTPRSDIYSFGVLLYQMLSGKHLFDGETAVEVALQHLNKPAPALEESLSQYQRLLDKLLEKDRDARFRNADEVIGFLARKYQQD